MGLHGPGPSCLAGRRRHEPESSGKAGAADEVTWLLNGGRCVRSVHGPGKGRYGMQPRDTQVTLVLFLGRGRIG